MLQVKIVSPEKYIYHGEAKSVRLPTLHGEEGFLPGHCRIMARVVPGMVRVQEETNLRLFQIEEGYVHVDSDSLLLFTAKAAEIL